MADTTTVSSQYLTFILDDQLYAMPVTNVREVQIVPGLTHVPNMLPYMRGIINLRESAVPVIDLKICFDLGKTEITQNTAVIVVERDTEESEKSVLGLFADAVKKVISIDLGNIQPPPKVGTAIDAAYINGIARLENDFIILLDIEKILAATAACTKQTAQAADAPRQPAPNTVQPQDQRQ